MRKLLLLFSMAFCYAIIGNAQVKFKFHEYANHTFQSGKVEVKDCNKIGSLYSNYIVIDNTKFSFTSQQSKVSYIKGVLCHLYEAISENGKSCGVKILGDKNSDGLYLISIIYGNSEFIYRGYITNN